MSDRDDLWRTIRELKKQVAELESRLEKLEQAPHPLFTDDFFTPPKPEIAQYCNMCPSPLETRDSKAGWCPQCKVYISEPDRLDEPEDS